MIAVACAIRRSAEVAGVEGESTRMGTPQPRSSESQARSSDSSPRRSDGRICVAVCGVAALLVFVLPLLVPVHPQSTVSASYVAGFNNRAATLAAACTGIAVLLWSWRRATGQRPSPEKTQDAVRDRLSATWIAIGVLLNSGLTALIGTLIARAHLRYLADMGYFIEQMSASQQYGRPLYTGLEFAYGPLLFYPGVLVHAALHSSWHTAYIVTLMLHQGVGLALLAYILNALPIGRTERRAGFVLLAIGAVNPLLGLNYTFFRFLTPFAAMLFATRTQSILRTTLLLAAGALVSVGISAEIGLAFLAGCITLSGFRAAYSGAVWLLTGAIPVAVVAVVLLAAGAPYLRMLASFSRGALSLPVAPYPHLLVFLFTLVWLVPRWLGAALGEQRAYAARLAACAGIGLGLLPAALNRCDPLHVFFNGAGLILLSLAAIRSAERPVRLTWLAALVVFVGWQQWVNNTLYLDRTISTLSLALHPRHPRLLMDELVRGLDPQQGSAATDALDLGRLQRQVGNAAVATPLEVSTGVEDALKRSGHYRSDFYAFMVDVMNPTAEQRKIEAMNQAAWALLPAEYDGPFLETPQNIDGVQGFTFPYPQRHTTPYPLGQAFDDNLDDRWQDAGRYGPYILYRNRYPPAR